MRNHILNIIIIPVAPLEILNSSVSYVKKIGTQRTIKVKDKDQMKDRRFKEFLSV